MSKCIKTGARIFIEEFGGDVACDLHMDVINDRTIIIVRYNPLSLRFNVDYNCKLTLGHRYIHDLGFIVCGLSDFDRDIREFCYL